LIVKKSPASSKRAGRERPLSRSRAKHHAEIAATIERLDELKPESARAARLIGLLRSWLSDESSYDEQTWPKLKKALDVARERVGARRLFLD
jgi:hypothetical protein